MKEKGISFGIRIKKNFVDKIDEIVKNSAEINTNRSELIEAIIDSFFSVNKEDFKEKGKRFVMVKRRREYEGE